MFGPPKHILYYYLDPLGFRERLVAKSATVPDSELLNPTGSKTHNPRPFLNSLKGGELHNGLPTRNPKHP